jgi:hypothetical protein
MMEKISKEQTAAIAKKMKDDHARAIRRKKRIEKLWVEATWGMGVVVMIAFITVFFAVLVEDRINKYPHLGDSWFPTTPEERAEAAKPKVYVGR